MHKERRKPRKIDPLWGEPKRKLKSLSPLPSYTHINKERYKSKDVKTMKSKVIEFNINSANMTYLGKNDGSLNGLQNKSCP